MTHTRIDLKMFDLNTDRIKEAIAHWIQLHPTHIVYHVECHIVKMPNTAEGEFEEKEEYVHYHGTILRDRIVAIDIDFSDWGNEFDVWVVEIHVGGMATAIKIKWETSEEAYQFHNKLTQYILSK